MIAPVDHLRLVEAWLAVSEPARPPVDQGDRPGPKGRERRHAASGRGKLR